MKGVLLANGKTAAYYSIAAASIGFIFPNKGLIYDLTFEGSKITRIGR